MTRKKRDYARHRLRDRSGRSSHNPPADILCEVFDALQRGARPPALHKRYPLTERTLYRYIRYGPNYKPLLRARWWQAHRERARAMVDRGCSWIDVFVRLKAPRELFSHPSTLRIYTYDEEIREAEYRNAADKYELSKAAA